MNYSVRIWSKAYAPSPDMEHFSIQVDKRLWEKVMQDETMRRKFIRILHPTQENTTWIAPIGQPVVTHMDDSENNTENIKYDIFLPLWMIDTNHLSGEGEEATIQVMNEEYFPEASRIKIRVIDSAFYNSDVKDELEKAFSALGVVQEHTTLQIPITNLGGYKVEVFVSETEPANIVLCDGEEVALEFEEPIDQMAPVAPAPEPQRPPTPIPAPPPPFPIQENSQFPGEGYTVGTSNAHIPEWRRGLPPPPRR